MHAARSELLQAAEMSELHKSLVNLRVLHYLSVDDVILQVGITQNSILKDLGDFIISSIPSKEGRS